MKLKISSELVYQYAHDTQVIACVHAARSSDQTIVREALTVTPHTDALESVDGGGDRRLRLVVGGQVTIRYDAEVDNSIRRLLPTSGRQHRWGDLPAETLPYLLPSRFCPSDQFQRFAQRQFGQHEDGVARVMAILDWINQHVDYVPGTSTAETTAEDTFMRRAGVCRDFTHLGIALCRAQSIPARAVSAYALDLDPPDFHAVMEVYLANTWWMVDPTRLAPAEGLVRIASGRDAADIAFLTTDKPCQLVAQAVTVNRA